MSYVQDPHKQIGYLQQCFSSDKKPLGFFLGAGCPMAIKIGEEKVPLIPDINGITEVVREKLAECKECGPLLKTVDEHFKKDSRVDTTVEDMLSHIRALRAVAGKDEVRRLSAANLDKLDGRICEIIHELVNKELPNTETPYHRIASWVDAIGREKPVEIFTTNYDLLMEQAFEDCRVPYFDGFAGARKPFFDIRAMEEDELPPRWARLWKLHGSINWHQVGKDVLRGTTNEEKDSKRVIHPSHLKYEESRRMPYLAMLDKLMAFLKQPTATLVLCGYSFRDQHLNDVIRQGLQSTPTAIAFALLFDTTDRYSQAVKLDRWSDDLKQGLEREIKELDKQIRESRRTAALAGSLHDKLEAQKSLKTLETARNRKRRELFDAQDAIDAQRDDLIGRIEMQLRQRHTIKEVFMLRWSLA